MRFACCTCNGTGLVNNPDDALTAATCRDCGGTGIDNHSTD